VPDEGPWPAYWTELDLASYDRVSGHTAGLYEVHDLAMDSASLQLYALGRCAPSDGYALQGLCISVYDPKTDRVVRYGGVVSPTASVSGEEGRLVLAGETLYVHQPWAGMLYGLNPETLGWTTTLTGVHGVAYDAANEATFVLTSEGLTTLAGDTPPVGVDRRYDTSPLEMIAGGGRLYVLGETKLQVFEGGLRRVAQVDLPGGYLTGLLLDLEHNRLYIGGYAGLYVLDTETLRLRNPMADNVMEMTLDRKGERLYLLTRHQRDWYGGYTAIALDVETWSAEELYTTQSGDLRALAVDEDSGRLLLASTSDHSLLPIYYGTGEVAPRLPLGIEADEVIVDPVGERLYVSDSAGWVNVLDRRTYDPVARFYGGRHISLDMERGVLYAGDARVPVVSQFDVRTGEVVLEIPQAGTPRANPVAGQVVVLNRAFFVYDAESGELVGKLRPRVGQPSTECPECYYTVGVEATIDAQRGYTATLTYTPWPGKPGPSESLVYDPSSGRAFYSLRTGGYVHFSSISVYTNLSQFERRAQALRVLEGVSGDLALDAAVQQLYVARSNMLLVLDSETLNRRGRVYTEGWTPRVAAVDTEMGRLYLPRGRTLEVWNRTGAVPDSPLPPETLALTNMVTAILPSPNYAEDHTLLATIDGWPARSTDGGETWQRLRGGLPEFGDYRPTVSLAFSPSFAEDRRLFAGIALGETHGEGVYCSQNAGESWQMCSDGLYDLRIYRVLPSPAFGQDRTLLAYAHTPHGDALYRSTDAGASWHLELRQTEMGRPPLPGIGELFYLSEYEPQMECDYRGKCQRSEDGGKTWTKFETAGIPLENLVKVAFSPQYTHDQTIYFMTQTELIRFDEGSSAWARCQASVAGQPIFGGRSYERYLADLAVAASTEYTHVLLIGSMAGEFYRVDASDLACTVISAEPDPGVPKPAPSPTPCSVAADERLVDALFQLSDGPRVLKQLGCAVADAHATGAAIEPFERGWMIWREDLGEIYVLPEGIEWSRHEDTWTSEESEPEQKAPGGLFAPVRGFGKLWREQLGGPDSALGWATAPERGITFLIQSFANGLLLRGTDGELFVLYEDGTWARLEE
jgi:DNA-binding beta-propeller fold protein YncE